ncbi:hypothetical protein [Streptomyces sp. NPDC048142]|uniref:hypothetical protein n=1 Tax=Streptomyces sp. NPDC048142 TaxID=3365501 RepID=UPI00371C27E7
MLDLFVKPMAGLATSMDGDTLIIQFEAQGGLMVRVHMDDADWGWLGAILADKRAARTD